MSRLEPDVPTHLHCDDPTTCNLQSLIYPFENKFETNNGASRMNQEEEDEEKDEEEEERGGGKIEDDHHAPFSQIHPLKNGYRRTNGPTNGRLDKASYRDA